MQKAQVIRKEQAQQAIESINTILNAQPQLAANDTLYGELELRYGGAFAQWVVDGLGI